MSRPDPSTDELLIASITKVGKEKYLWVAGTLNEWLDGKGVKHYGYVDSFVKGLAGLHDARALLDPSLKMSFAAPANQRGNIMRLNIPAGFAREWHRKLQDEKRGQRISNSTETSPMEFVYLTSYSIDDWTVRSIPYLILKKTPKKIIIHCHPYTHGHVCKETRTIHLNRKALEDQGFVRYGAFYDEFTLKPESLGSIPISAWHNKQLQDQTALLGVTWPCSKRDVTRAFRVKVKTAHPDKGGDTADFIALRKAYEQLVAVAQ